MGRRRGRHVATRARPRRWIAVVGLLASASVAAGILFTLPSTFASAGATPEVRPTVSALDKDWAGGPPKVTALEAEPTYGTVGSPLSMDDPYEGFVPVQCPDGTVARTVDANGNQGECQPAATEPEG